MRRLALGQTDDVMSDDEMYPYTAEGRDVLILRGVQNKIFCVRTDILSSLAHMVNMRDSPTVWRQVSLLEMSSSDA